MVQTWGGVKLIKKSWIFLVDHFKMTGASESFQYSGVSLQLP